MGVGGSLLQLVLVCTSRLSWDAGTVCTTRLSSQDCFADIHPSVQLDFPQILTPSFPHFSLFKALLPLPFAYFTRSINLIIRLLCLPPSCQLVPTARAWLSRVSSVWTSGRKEWPHAFSSARGFQACCDPLAWIRACIKSCKHEARVNQPCVQPALGMDFHSVILSLLLKL